MNKFTKLIIYFAYYLEDSQRYKRFKGFFETLLNEEKSRSKMYFDFFMVILVLMSIFILIYDVKNNLNKLWYDFESIVLFVFVLEYLFRVWVYNDSRTVIIENYEKANFLNEPFSLLMTIKDIFMKKLCYLLTPLAIIDLLALLPSFRGFRILRIFLLFRLFKLFRYARSINEFIKVLADKKFELFTLTLLVFFVVFASSTAIYIFEGDVSESKINTFFDAIYWSFVTISTVGYGDILPITDEGRVVTLVLIISGIALISFSTSIVASAFSEKLSELKVNRIKSEIEKIDDFVVICGYGQIGEIIAEKLLFSRDKFVIIEKNPARVELARAKGFLVLEADAKHKDTLLSAGVGSGAKKVLSLTDNEVVNIYITLSVKDIDKNIEVISRINQKSSEKKFLLAGANEVIYPFAVSALVATEYTGQPVAFEAIYGIVSHDQYGVSLEDIEIKKGSFLVDKALKDVDFKSLKVMLFGVVRAKSVDGLSSFNLKNRNFIFNPKDNFRLQVGDFIVVLGKDVSISYLRKLLERSILNA